MSSTEIPCDECYQRTGCQRVGHPVYTAELFDGREPDIVTPESCFLEVCAEGLLAAKKAYREAKRVGVPTEKAFGTEHKPYIREKSPHGHDIQGRFVAYGCDDRENGDVVAILEGTPYKLTNIFQYHPWNHAISEEV